MEMLQGMELLFDKMRKNGENEQDISDLLGINQRCFVCKCRREQGEEFNLGQIRKLAAHYCLSPKETVLIFLM